MNSYSLSIRQMMTGLVILIAILLLGLMIMIWQMSLEVKANLIAINDFELTSFKVKDIRYHTVQVQQFLTDVALTHNIDGVERAREHEKSAQILFTELMQLLPKRKEEIGKTSIKLKEMQRVGELMVNAYIRQGKDAGNALMQQPATGFDDLSLMVQAGVDQILKDLEKSLKQHADLSLNEKKLVNHSVRIQLITFVLIFLIIVIAILFVGRRIREMFNLLDEVFLKLSQGDLIFRVKTRYGGEIGKIAHMANHFIENFGGTVRKFIKINEQISSSTAENYVNAHDTAIGINKQSQQIEDISLAINQFNSSISHLSEATISTSNLAQDMAKLVQSGSDSIHTAVESMNQVTERSGTSTEILKALGQRSTEIGKIAEVIKDIAAQTNLLALNAAIEAARAGDQGRGFAVVADEVRQLAVKTSQATGRITEMVKGVQDETLRSVNSMEAVSESVVHGVALIQEARNALGKIMQHSELVTHQMMNMASTAEEQAETTRQFAENMDTISKVSHNIADRAQQDAARADNLATVLVAELEQIIHYYQLEREETKLQGAALDELLQSVPPLFKWEEDLRVGIVRVDEQHLVLINLINRLNAALKKRISTTVTEGIIRELLNYTKTHFGMEEELFKRYHYPDPEHSAHLRFHAEFIKTIDDVHKKFSQGDSTVGIKILNFLRQWLIEHIKGTDKKYAPFLKQHGVT